MAWDIEKDSNSANLVPDTTYGSPLGATLRAQEIEEDVRNQRRSQQTLPGMGKEMTEADKKMEKAWADQRKFRKAFGRGGSVMRPGNQDGDCY